MSNEVGINIVGTLNNGAVRDKFDTGNINRTQTNANKFQNVQLIGTTAEAVTFGDLVSPGEVVLRNIDPTNYITYGPDDSGTMKVLGRLPPLGPEQVIYLETGVTLKAKADTASCKMTVKAWDK